MVVSKRKTPRTKTRRPKTYENEDLRKRRPPTKFVILKEAAVAHVLQNTQNLVISRCCFVHGVLVADAVVICLRSLLTGITTCSKYIFNQELQQFI